MEKSGVFMLHSVDAYFFLVHLRSVKWKVRHLMLIAD